MFGCGFGGFLRGGGFINSLGSFRTEATGEDRPADCCGTSGDSYTYRPGTCRSGYYRGQCKHNRGDSFCRKIPEIFFRILAGFVQTIHHRLGGAAASYGIISTVLSLPSLASIKARA